MNWLSSSELTIALTPDDLRTLRAGRFPLDEPVRVDVTVAEAVLPMLVVRRDSDRLVVLHNGAVDLERSGARPIFQRSSWWQEIEAHQIFVCDPGTVGDQALSLNWMQAVPPIWPAHLVTKSVRLLSNALGVTRARQRLYFGSSAGGFSALACLGYDINARAVVNNAQFDWTRWYPHQVRDVLTRHFPGRTAADVRGKWPGRTNVLHQLGRGTKSLTVDYWINLASQYDRQVQLPFWSEFLQRNPRVAGHSSLLGYYDEASGHNPLTKERTLDLLNG